MSAERTYEVVVQTTEHFVAVVQARNAQEATEKARRHEWDDIDAVGNRTPPRVVSVHWRR